MGYTTITLCSLDGKLLLTTARDILKADRVENQAPLDEIFDLFRTLLLACSALFTTGYFAMALLLISVLRGTALFHNVVSSPRMIHQFSSKGNKPDERVMLFVRLASLINPSKKCVRSACMRFQAVG